MSKVVKPVGTGVLYHTSRHALGICRRVCNTCRYSVPRGSLEGQSLETIIENAVADVVMQHAILGVGIACESTKDPHFTFVEAINLQEMVKWKALSGEGKAYDDGLMRSLEGIHDQLWEDLETRPGWEVIVHHSDEIGKSGNVNLDITFAFHHAYADGVASKLFHRDFLRALNDSGSVVELEDHILRLSSKPELLPGMEEMVPFTISWPYLLRTIWNEIIWQNFVPGFFKSKPEPESIPWTGQNVSPEPHEANVRLLEISQDTLTSVLKTCREHKVTLTPLLHVLIAASLAQRLPVETAPAFAHTTPIDLRRFAKSEYDVVNNITGLVSAHDDKFTADSLSRVRHPSAESKAGKDTLIWQTASALSARLRQKVATLPKDDIVGMMSWVSDWEKFWTDKFGGKRGWTWEVSNIGSVRVEGGAWRITRSVMTQGALPAGSAFSVNVAGVEGEGLCLSLTWQKTVVEKELMEDLAGDLEKWLTVLGDTGTFEHLKIVG